MIRFAAFAASIICISPALADGVDLAKEYPATLDYSPEVTAYPWEANADDVWRLSAFRFELGDELEVETGAATVVFGIHKKNVLWAVLLPDEPGALHSSAATQREKVASVWFRFHPARVGELFPENTVIGHGDPAALLWARRICAWKINGSWQAGNKPVVPQRNSLVIDAEIEGGVRRFFINDTDAGTVKYEPFFTSRALPKLEDLSRADAAAVFEKVWRAFDEEYAMFTIKPDVDWAALRREYEPRMRAVKTSYAAAAVIAEMLAKLEDLHVWVRVGDEYVPCYNRARPLNANYKSIEKLVGEFTEDSQLAWARSKDDIGYIAVRSLGDPDLPAAFDRALEKLGDTWGLIVDLRYNGGGDEVLAQKMAGRLIDTTRVYSYSQYRNGAKHNDLTEKFARECAPRGPWRYASPVITLIGPRTMSSAESFACMLAVCPQVQTLGDHTAGASANPRQVDAGAKITVNLPRWLDLGPDGKSFESVGITPDIIVNATPEDFRNDDPVLRRALEELRKTPEADRHAGKRD